MAEDEEESPENAGALNAPPPMPAALMEPMELIAMACACACACARACAWACACAWAFLM